MAKLTIRKPTRNELYYLNYLAFLFEKEIQKNSPLNKLKTTTYRKPRLLSQCSHYDYFKKHSLFVAIENKQIVGFASGRILTQRNKAISKYGKLDDLFVLEKFRSKGYASKLVKTLIQHVKTKDCKAVVLFASPNKPISKYYARSGFKPIYHYMFKKI